MKLEGFNTVPEEFGRVVRLVRIGKIWEARSHIASLMREAGDDLGRKKTYMRLSFALLLSKDIDQTDLNGGVVRSILSDLHNVGETSNALREEFVVSGMNSLLPITKSDVWTGALLAKDLQKASRDDVSLLAKVDAAIHMALPK